MMTSNGHQAARVVIIFMGRTFSFAIKSSTNGVYQSITSYANKLQFECCEFGFAVKLQAVYHQQYILDLLAH